MTRVVAWQVECADPDHGSNVVFCDTRTEARQAGNGDLCDCGYIETRAKRFPEVDSYAPGPVHPHVLIVDHGWWFYCDECQAMLSESNLDRQTAVLTDTGIACVEHATSEVAS